MDANTQVPLADVPNRMLELTLDQMADALDELTRCPEIEEIDWEQQSAIELRP